MLSNDNGGFMANRMKVIVAYDGSACADAALDDLLRAGLPKDAQFQVLSVVEHWLPPPSALEIVEHIGKDQEYQALANRAAIRLVEIEPSWEVKTEVAVGSPGRVIIEKSDQWKSDLIVIGSHGHTALGRFFLGSVSQKVLHDAHCSVRVARGRIEENETPARLIIGVDGSSGAEAAVDAVIARAWPPGSGARVVNASRSAPPISSEYLAGQMVDWFIKEEKRINETVEAAVGRLNGSGLKTEAVIREEEPKKLLIGEAEKWGADCIFLGAKGMGRIERFLIGSVSSAVAARAHCSVEVVRAMK
jgi:nucleotide-binding universal stress UspA family protein